jgi:Leucine Rich repeat
MSLIRWIVAKVFGVARRGSRFGMRSLLLATSLCCVAMGTWAIYVQPYRDQAASLAKVSELGGLSSSVAARGPAWQRWLVETMVGPKQFVQVDRVDLRRCKVRAADLPSLGGLRFLRTLYLDRAEVTDAGVVVVARMAELQELSLTYTPLTDDGLAAVATLPKLRSLHMTGVPITDDSVESLARATTLEAIYLRWTRITSHGASKLAALLPNCRVYHHEIQ